MNNSCEKKPNHEQFLKDIKSIEKLLDYLNTNSIEIFNEAKDALENIKKGSGCPHFQKCPKSTN